MTDALSDPTLPAPFVAESTPCALGHFHATDEEHVACIRGRVRRGYIVVARFTLPGVAPEGFNTCRTLHRSWGDAQHCRDTQRRVLAEAGWAVINYGTAQGDPTDEILNWFGPELETDPGSIDAAAALASSIEKPEAPAESVEL